MTRLLATVALAASLLLGAPAFAKGKKAKKAAPAQPTAPRVLIYDADHPAGPPDVLGADASAAKIPDAPLMRVTMAKEPEDVSVSEKSVIMDQANAPAAGETPKKKKAKKKKKADD